MFIRVSALGNDEPAEQRREAQPYDRNDGNGGVLEGVAGQDHGLLQPLGACRSDVVFIQDFQHCGSGHSGDQRHDYGACRERR